VKYPEATLAKVRDCLHSEIAIHGQIDGPDYRCQKDVPQSKLFSLGPACRLLAGQTCRSFDPFPESHNS